MSVSAASVVLAFCLLQAHSERVHVGKGAQTGEDGLQTSFIISLDWCEERTALI